MDKQIFISCLLLFNGICCSCSYWNSISQSNASPYCNSRRWCFPDDRHGDIHYQQVALNPIIIVLNNNGYGTERPMLDGPFNDLLPWNYFRIPEIISHGKGFMIETESQLEESLLPAESIYSQELCIL